VLRSAQRATSQALGKVRHGRVGKLKCTRGARQRTHPGIQPAPRVAVHRQCGAVCEPPEQSDSGHSGWLAAPCAKTAHSLARSFYAPRTAVRRRRSCSLASPSPQKPPPSERNRRWALVRAPAPPASTRLRRSGPPSTRFVPRAVAPAGKQASVAPSVRLRAEPMKIVAISIIRSTPPCDAAPTAARPSREWLERCSCYE
jgi:hypothetical protein